ncbi:hypothetical protein [Miltoncostaea marina]|uniref:hypothetical protein n=1 Tax=Miltoncostaea marina TaxID=2843215 RepID=UPI001C3E5528|nr:hypothetical protein [Miltoncostaea marina]
MTPSAPRLLAAAGALCAAAAALAATAPPAGAVPAGTGVRGTLTASWGGIAGEPITAWSGELTMTFDPSAAARADTLAAVARPELGEAVRRPFAPQVQAARVTRLRSDSATTVICTGTDAEGEAIEWRATATSSVASIADGRVAWELVAPRFDLLRGRGDVWLEPHGTSDPQGWYVNDRFTLPGRYAASDAWPCPGDGAPAARLPRIIALNGGGAVPRAVSYRFSEPEVKPLRRTPRGWRIVMGTSRREAFAESPFGPQDRQSIDVRIASDLYLTGSPAALGARCQAPVEEVRRARTSAAALRLARRAGMTRVRFAGTRRTLPRGWRPHFRLTGPIDSMSHYRCGTGAFRITRYAPRA